MNLKLNDPTGVTLDAGGDVYIADALNSVVWKVTPRGTISRFAGTTTPCTHVPRCGDGGPAREAQLDNPVALAVGPRGEVYIVDQGANEVREVSVSGTIIRLAGTGRPCRDAGRCGDGGPALTARLDQPAGVAVDQAGDVFIAGYVDQEVHEISPDGEITRFAGTGRQCFRSPPCGDGGPATAARLFYPAGVAVDESGNVYIADSDNHEVRRVTPDGTITRFAGSGRVCQSARVCGDGLPATNASLSIPLGLALDASGNLYITDPELSDVREVSPSGTISRIAGNGTPCTSAPRCRDGGPAVRGELNDPEGIAVDPQMHVYIADSGDQEVREVTGGRRPLAVHALSWRPF